MMVLTTNLLISSLTSLYLIIFLTTNQTLAFMSMLSKSQPESKVKTHQDITREAILKTAVEVCRSLAAEGGKKFETPDSLTVISVAQACSTPESAKDFQSSINEINKHNTWIDVQYPISAQYHFNNEEFWSGRDLITQGVSDVKKRISEKNYEAAREGLGKALHTLQDFYSHSNWIELGKTESFSNLTNPNTLISNIADSETCRSCYGYGCPGNILEVVIAEKKLTSGYFDESKPKGKCSHGGDADISSWGEGGISKDSTISSHGHLHELAAVVAINATAELLEKIITEIGDSEFLRLLGLGHNFALCFVIDTTSSMADDIAILRKVTTSIVESRRGTSAEPLEYILVTFGDPDFDILTRTSDPEVFEDQVNAIVPVGGGDDPEICLTGLKLALEGSPPQSEIFVFTDAETKDGYLSSNVQALIESKMSVVTFILTRSSDSQHRRRNTFHLYDEQSLTPQPFNTEFYQDLARASGGHVVEISSIKQASDIATITAGPTMVTLFQTVRHTPKKENFFIFVDFSVQKLTVHITGNSTFYIIISPTGVSQNASEHNNTGSWPVQIVGNLTTVQPNELEQAGLWRINVESEYPYSIKVVGESVLDFLYDFVEFSEGPHAGYTVLRSRPIANTNLTILLSMVGGENVDPTEVSLVEELSTNSFTGKIDGIGNDQYLVSFKKIPFGQFTVRVLGKASFSSNVILNFERQSATRFHTSNLVITAQSFETLEIGTPFPMSFTLATNGSGGRFILRFYTDVRTKFSKTPVILESGITMNYTLILEEPNSNRAGEEVMMTLQAEAEDGSDFNYIVVRFLLVSGVVDLFPPICAPVSMSSACPGPCNRFSWNLTAILIGGYGSGAPSVKLIEGNGKLNITSGPITGDIGLRNTTIVYTASCCDQDLTLIAVDEMGNVVTCYKSLKATAAPSTFSYGAEFFLILPLCLWIHVVDSLDQFMPC